MCQGACKQLPRQCEDLARDIYGYFKNSAKRVAELREFQNFCHVEPHKILKPSQTRWLSLTEVVKRISAQWEALRLFFTDQWIDARLNAAENIYHALNDESLRLYYHFLEWALPKFTDLNQYFQSEGVVITSLRSKMCETYKDLLLTFMQRDYVLHTALSQISFNDDSKFFITQHNVPGCKSDAESPAVQIHTSHPDRFLYALSKISPGCLWRN